MLIGWDSKKSKPRPESMSQMLFYMIASVYCKINNLDITPEAETGRGPVDFKVSSGFSDRVLVEVKLSSNPGLLHGYTTQLELAEFDVYLDQFAGDDIAQAIEQLVQQNHLTRTSSRQRTYDKNGRENTVAVAGVKITIRGQTSYKREVRRRLSLGEDDSILDELTGTSLSHEQILRLYQATVDAQLVNRRDALLSGIDPHFVATIKVVPVPADQIRIDLDALNSCGSLADGSIPLQRWLTSAISLAGGRRETLVFQEILDSVAAQCALP